MTIQLRWPLRVLAVAISPFVLLGSGRAIFFAVEAFSLWLGIEATFSEVTGAYFGVVGGLVITAALLFVAFRVWRPLNVPSSQDDTQ